MNMWCVKKEAYISFPPPTSIPDNRSLVKGESVGDDDRIVPSPPLLVLYLCSIIKVFNEVRDVIIVILVFIVGSIRSSDSGSCARGSATNS